MRVLSLVVAGVITAGCGSSAPAVDTASFQIDTLESSLIRVVNDGTGAWSTDQVWRLEEDLRLGTVAGEGPEQFSQVAWIQEDDRGNIYVLDYPAQDIRVFRSDGSFSHTIGRKGEGPGEFTSAAGLNWGPDGLLWVWGSQRYSVFQPDGTFVTSHPRRTRGVIYPWNGGFADGDYIDWGLDRERGANPNETTGLTTMYPIRFTPPERYDTLPPLRFNAWMAEQAGRMLLGESKGIMLAQTGDGHVWFAHTDEYTLFKRTLEGDTLLSTSVPSRPASVPVAEIDSMIGLMAERGVDHERDDFVKERRLVTRVLVDESGMVYVFPWEPDVPQGTAMDVFDPDGIYQGRVDLPETVLTRGPPPYVTRDHVYGVVNDEFDVPFVVRWRIVRN